MTMAMISSTRPSATRVPSRAAKTFTSADSGQQSNRPQRQQNNDGTIHPVPKVTEVLCLAQEHLANLIEDHADQEREKHAFRQSEIDCVDVARQAVRRLFAHCSGVGDEERDLHAYCHEVHCHGRTQSHGGRQDVDKKTEWGPGSHRTRIMPEVIERERETVEAAPSSLDLFDHDGVGQEHSVFKAQSNADRRPRAHKVGS
mmetsp:Transcript_31031/g.73199  ORF Transcript_31031/g.73199 Transcript_31031/m.73199 type:complete len:201 (-) Transcript_31031:179-781(-)